MKFTVRAAVVAALALVSAAAIGAPSPGKKKLIEFGWGEPDTRFMHDHIDQLQASPFDGCVFHVNYRLPNGTERNFSWDVWGKNRLDPARGIGLGPRRSHGHALRSLQPELPARQRDAG